MRVCLVSLPFMSNTVTISNSTSFSTHSTLFSGRPIGASLKNTGLPNPSNWTPNTSHVPVAALKRRIGTAELKDLASISCLSEINISLVSGLSWPFLSKSSSASTSARAALSHSWFSFLACSRFSMASSLRFFLTRTTIFFLSIFSL